MSTTQDHIPILDLQEGVVLLKDGSAVVILKTSAVNFGLLSGEEQMAIIGSFAQMLNSLSFPIQIVIRSTRLDITAYLKLLDKALKVQLNPLLAQLMIHYRQFVESLIKDNEVLDKSFYVVVPLSRMELGLAPKKEERLKKAQTILLPRRDQMIRQLSRVGLKADHLLNQEVIKLFYDIYNAKENPTSLNEISTTSASLPEIVPQEANFKKPIIQQAPLPPIQTAPPPSSIIQPPSSNSSYVSRPIRSHPFVVEELGP